jgi:cyclic-di-GMP phosphodiesterase TipF (flagellum assembly factor)
VRQDHIDVFVQPIVNLPQRKLRMYEVYARLRAHAGSYIPAGRYLELALKESLVPAIDNLLLLRCLQILRDRRDDDFAMPYILNISSTTLHDTGFMNDLVVFLSQYRSLANRLIFELPLQEIEDAEKILIEIIDGLSKLGCRFSVDQIRKRRIDINMLRARHIRFIKLDAEWLLREAAQEGGQARITKLKKMLDRAGLDLIVEKIEKEKELRNLLDFGIDYGQGFYFGKPDLHAVYRSKERRESVA